MTGDVTGHGQADWGALSENDPAVQAGREANMVYDGREITAAYANLGDKLLEFASQCSEPSLARIANMIHDAEPRLRRHQCCGACAGTGVRRE